MARLSSSATTFTHNVSCFVLKFTESVHVKSNITLLYPFFMFCYNAHNTTESSVSARNGLVEVIPRKDMWVQWLCSAPVPDLVRLSMLHLVPHHHPLHRQLEDSVAATGMTLSCNTRTLHSTSLYETALIRLLDSSGSTIV